MGGHPSKEVEKGAMPEGTIDISKVLDDLRDMRKKGKNNLQVERNKVLEIGLAYFKQDDCEFSPLEITFTTDGVLEDCIDLGGPTREFFTIFLKEFLRKDIAMFEGQEQGRNLFPANNSRAINGNHFAILGKAIVMSLISGGPGFRYLAPYVVSYMRNREFEHQLNIGLVYNTFLRQLIKRINNAVTEDQLISALASDRERFIDNCGWPRNLMVTMKNRLQLTQTLLKWELIGKRKAAIDQLKHGLNTFDFLFRTSNIRDADETLLHSDTEKETAEYLKKTLRKSLEKLEATCTEEKNAKKFLRACMEAMSDSEATSLFHFMTGMSSLPVDDIPLETQFNRVNRSAVLPEAVTCIQRLLIPLGNSSQMEFTSSFYKALSTGKYGFHGVDL